MRLKTLLLLAFTMALGIANGQKLNDDGRLSGTFNYHYTTAGCKTLNPIDVDVEPDDSYVYPQKNQRAKKWQRKTSIAALSNDAEDNTKEGTIRNFEIKLAYKNVENTTQADFKDFAYTTRFFVTSHDTTRVLLHLKAYKGKNIYANLEKLTLTLTKVDESNAYVVPLPAGDLTAAPVALEIKTVTTGGAAAGTTTVTTTTKQVLPTSTAATATQVDIALAGTAPNVEGNDTYALVAMVRNPGLYQLKMAFPDKTNLAAAYGNFKAAFELLLITYK